MTTKKSKNSEDLDFLAEKLNTIRADLITARKLLKDNGEEVLKIIPKKGKEIKVNNIFHIVPNVRREYEEFEKNKEKTVVELLNKYEEWASAVFVAVVNNVGKLKQEKLKAHLDSSLLICESLDFSIRSIFHIK